MEMHQIRYFLAVAQALNFTRAAEACNVSQPSLTRAVKNLEAELGGELFHRERANTHLTELGRAMLPLLTNSHEAAIAAKAQAKQLKTGSTSSLRLALTQAVDFDVVSDAVQEISRSFQQVNLSFQRICGDELLENLRSGTIEVAVAGQLEESWDRLDSWALFAEPHCAVLRADHALADRASLDADFLIDQRLILRPYCLQWATCAALLKAQGVDVSNSHEVSCDRDALRFLEAGLGVAVVPVSTRIGDKLRKIPLELPFQKEVRLYTVSGRPRSQALNGFINLLRSADWSRYNTVASVA